MKARLASHVGTSAYLRIYVPSEHECTGVSAGHRGSKLSYHNARVLIATSHKLDDNGFAGDPEDYMSEFTHDPRWPDRCEGCLRGWDELDLPVRRQVFYERRWDTPNGELTPGCLFFVDWEHWKRPVASRTIDGKTTVWKTPTACMHGWSNCDGRHLHAICPDGGEWNIDGRAQNCAKPEDQEHRCWVREGEPPDVTVGKGGNTCSAGGGSVVTPNWHGFLRSGLFVPC